MQRPEELGGFLERGEIPRPARPLQRRQRHAGIALMADGVPAHKLYPLDLDRAFKMLDKIKPHVTVWWTSGAQNTQILQSGEVDMSDTWGARAFAAIDGGAPVQDDVDAGPLFDRWLVDPEGHAARRPGAQVRALLHEARSSRRPIPTSSPTGRPTRRPMSSSSPERAKMLPTSPENIKGLAADRRGVVGAEPQQGAGAVPGMAAGVIPR